MARIICIVSVFPYSCYIGYYYNIRKSTKEFGFLVFDTNIHKIYIQNFGKTFFFWNFLQRKFHFVKRTFQSQKP